MLDEPRSLFSYLAFDRNSQKLLAHGQTAELARQWANEVSPSTELELLLVGKYGRTFWSRNFSLRKARQLLLLVEFPSHASEGSNSSACLDM